MTRGFVPHIDAGLVVLGADPPISADELALVQEIATQTPELIFVLNNPIGCRIPKGERRAPLPSACWQRSWAGPRQCWR